MISFVSFPASLPAVNLSDNAVSSPSCRVKSRPIVAFATATAEAHSSWTEQPRPSYLNSPCSSLYEVLGIPVSASNQEIKVAYRRLARVCHPTWRRLTRKTCLSMSYEDPHCVLYSLGSRQARQLRSEALPTTTAVVEGGGVLLL